MVIQSAKRCSRCGVTKPRSAFNRSARNKDGLQVYCKDCSAEVSHSKYELKVGRRVARRSRSVYEVTRGRWLRSLKVGRPCTDCGKLFDPQVMQWDHLPGFEKLGDISGSWVGRTEGEILAEIAKCELVCTNCHTIRTFRRNGWRGWSLSESEAAYGESWTRTAA